MCTKFQKKIEHDRDNVEQEQTNGIKRNLPAQLSIFTHSPPGFESTYPSLH